LLILLLRCLFGDKLVSVIHEQALEVMVENEFELFPNDSIRLSAFDQRNESSRVLAQRVVWTQLHESHVVVVAWDMEQVVDHLHLDYSHQADRSKD